MSIVLQSTGGGSVTINEPTTASNFTQTLPAATGDVMVSGNMPAFSAYASVAQTVTSGVDTKVVFDTKTFDTNTNYSTANSRFTPTVAGYYQFNTIVRFNGTAPSQYIIYFFKNGASIGLANYINIALSSPLVIPAIAPLTYMNGSTDYFEVYAYIVATSPTLSAASINTSYFSGSLVRTA
jgi:hypothetical protein